MTPSEFEARFGHVPDCVREPLGYPGPTKVVTVETGSGIVALLEYSVLIKLLIVSVEDPTCMEKALTDLPLRDYPVIWRGT
jgi:hypothetical protein